MEDDPEVEQDLMTGFSHEEQAKRLYGLGGLTLSGTGWLP